jgi:hypothetical protein
MADDGTNETVFPFDRRGIAKPAREHRKAATFDVNEPWVEVLLEVEHHFDNPYLSGMSLRKKGLAELEVDEAALSHVSEGEIG